MRGVLLLRCHNFDKRIAIRQLRISYRGWFSKGSQYNIYQERVICDRVDWNLLIVFISLSWVFAISFFMSQSTFSKKFHLHTITIFQNFGFWKRPTKFQILYQKETENIWHITHEKQLMVINKLHWGYFINALFQKTY